MESAGPSVAGDKRKPSKDFEIEFKVFEHLMNPSKKSSCVKLAKPREPNCEQNCKENTRSYPSITVKTENCSNNDHAFHIMHDLNHQSILSMKTLYKSVPEMNTVSALVEEYAGLIDPHYQNVLADKHGYIPSETFQKHLRDIIDGIDFLKECDTYHGNLRWITTLYNRANDIKLANFEEDVLIDKRQAQWNDWQAILSMLLIVYNFATERNDNPEKSPKFFCGHLEELIEIISSADIDSLDVIKDKIFEAMFFWMRGTRARFLTTVVALLLDDENFMKDVEESDICDLPWDKNFACSKVAASFANLLAKMNAYRDGLGIPHYKTDIRGAFLRFICGAYTHRNELKIDVDQIVRAQYPKALQRIEVFG